MGKSRKITSGPALAALALLLAASLLYNPFWLHLRALSVLLGTVSEEPPGWLLRKARYPVRAREVQSGLGPEITRSRLYLPVGPEQRPGVVLVHGIHYLGIDEPRLVAFARALASAGVAVFTPEMAGLTAYRIEQPTVAATAAAARYLARLTGRATAGVIGISFAGGLALLAAADPALNRAIGFVVCLGAHHDLRRVAAFYAGQPTLDPEGGSYPVKPHPYGARVLIYANLPELFAPEDQPAARAALGTYLHDQHRHARELAGAMNEPARSKMLRLLDPDDPQAVTGELRSILAERGPELLRVSPRGKLARLRVPVFLLHGAGDPVVPATETGWLERELPPGTLSRSLVSPLLRHAELRDSSGLADYWAMVSFTAELLAATYRQL